MQAGAAGEAGEIEKDERHELDVLSIGSLFFPLIVVTLGLWTLSSLTVLRLIALKAAALNGISRGQAKSNLLQQLSIRLWTFNARMLLSRLELEVSDVGDWDLPFIG